MKTMRIPADSTRQMRITPLRSNLVLKERAEAAKHADEIIRRAREEAEQIREEGRSMGYREVAMHVAEAATYRARIRERCLPEIASLAAEMAKRILSRELRTSPQDVARICARVIRENQCGRKLRVYVHPDDLGLLRDENHPALVDPEVSVAFVPSNRVERGGCVVRGENGLVDGRLDVQLEELTRAMQED
jgi:flagellar biosynthesis/type III secretory pathway protein FliH